MKGKICQYCGNEFKTYQKPAKYCSQSCYKASKKINEVGSKKCKQCEREMNPLTKNDYKRIFCSQQCRVEYEKSNTRQVSEDTKQTKANKRRAQVERSKKLLEKYDLDKLQFPNFNPKACDYFKKFDINNKTQGHHALNGGEYYIEELGYFVDYINHDLKIIIEWDEFHHFDSNGNLLEKDNIRQNEIEGYFPNYEFRRIKQ